MFIEALCENMLRFKSNMAVENSVGWSERKRDNVSGLYKFVPSGCRYILPVEEIFYIGPYKAIAQVLE